MEDKQAELLEIDATLEVLKPIPIVIQDYGNEVFANFLEIEAYGAGRNEAEAISDLKGQIKQIYFELKETRNNELGKLPLDWKRTLLGILREK